MEGVLDIQSPIIFDESVAHYEIHAHQPYTSSSFNNSDEIRISIQHQDLCLLPFKSLLHIYDTTALQHTKFVNNAIYHMFEEIGYNMNAIEIDRCKNVGLTSIMKGYVSFAPRQNWLMPNVVLSDKRKIQQRKNNYIQKDIPIAISFRSWELRRETRVASGSGGCTRAQATGTSGDLDIEDIEHENAIDRLDVASRGHRIGDIRHEPRAPSHEPRATSHEP
ncbi:hypothetical protein TSAR_000799 [Trichomalopsis sarcophagae]|uniref:Double jelly roll-like domain-containing protein n=1 Tax=Trichomalopsis sarcophagae TaxID=543379 RepID=A0A232FL46_9HYME|nr:hypothetical protein TSAR_000799 [Trichomalopsis sarcophagae]